jgi:hypothetical protein
MRPNPIVDLRLSLCQTPIHPIMNGGDLIGSQGEIKNANHRQEYKKPTPTFHREYSPSPRRIPGDYTSASRRAHWRIGMTGMEAQVNVREGIYEMPDFGKIDNSRISW